MVRIWCCQIRSSGPGESGDHHLVCCTQSGILVAAIDGLGTAKKLPTPLGSSCNSQKASDKPIISLVERCHENCERLAGLY